MYILDEKKLPITVKGNLAKFLLLKKQPPEACCKKRCSCTSHSCTELNKTQFFPVSIVKNSVTFTEKHLCQSLFLIKL